MYGNRADWGTSEVTDMGSLFFTDSSTHRSFAKVFDGADPREDITGWNTGKVTNFYRTFFSSLQDNNFNQDISGWNTESATTIKAQLQRPKKNRIWQKQTLKTDPVFFYRVFFGSNENKISKKQGLFSGSVLEKNRVAPNPVFEQPCF
jgi:hypothetical protein